MSYNKFNASCHRKIFAVAMVLMTLGVSPAYPQKKRDIRGFFPGMGLAELANNFAQLQKAGQSYRLFRQSDCVFKDVASLQALGHAFGCDSSSDNFYFRLTRAYKPFTVYYVGYTFRAGVSPRQLVQMISDQFGARPSKVAPNIDQRMLDLAYLATWDLGDQTFLTLHIEGAYHLHLTDQSLIDSDKQAIFDAAHSGNPHPKF